jgi:hypothetical protein
VYRITLPSSSNPLQSDTAENPGVVPVPPGSSEFILRLTNPNAEGMNRKTRVENEVAIISLASAALKDFQPHIVPSVYGWGSAAEESSQGWILQELIPGSPVDETFDAMPFEEKKNILAQMARFLKALQEFKLPDSINQYGGVKFDDAGKIVSCAMTSVGSGPWPSYEAYFRDRLEKALKKSDDNPYIKGWHSNGVRQRLESFVSNGLPMQFENFESKDDKAIVHADFSEYMDSRWLKNLLLT